jgi:hypothetical protein
MNDLAEIGVFLTSSGKQDDRPRLQRDRWHFGALNQRAARRIVGSGQCRPRLCRVCRGSDKWNNILIAIRYAPSPTRSESQSDFGGAPHPLPFLKWLSWQKSHGLDAVMGRALSGQLMWLSSDR